MKRISKTEYGKILWEAKLLKGNQVKPKVILTKDDLIIKFFYRKSIFRRACNNAKILVERNISSITVLDELYYPLEEVYLLVCKRIPAITLCDLFANDNSKLIGLLPKVGEFMAKLHLAGIFVKDLHFGNVLFCNDGSLALIDIEEAIVKKKNKPLSMAMSARDIGMFIMRDYEYFLLAGMEHMLKPYLYAITPSKEEQDKLYYLIYKYLYNFVRKTEDQIAKLAKFNITFTPQLFVYASSMDDAVIKLTLVRKEAGVTVRELLNQSNDELLDKVILFVIYLHAVGIYYSGLSFSKILLKEDGSFALVRDQNAFWRFKVYKLPLSLAKRTRNLITIIKNEYEIIAKIGIKIFIEKYLANVKLSDRRKNKLCKLLQNALLGKMNLIL